MRDRWVDLVTAAVFGFLAVGCASLAVISLASEGPLPPQFVPAATATAAIFAAFTVWTLFEIGD